MKEDQENCYRYIWCGCQFIGQVLVLADSPVFFPGAKKQEFYSGTNGHFYLCDIKSQRSSPIIYRGQNEQFRANFFDKILH